MCKAFKFPERLAISSAPKAGFNNVKHRIVKELPCRVYGFVQSHLDSLDWAMILYEAGKLESRKSQKNIEEPLGVILNCS